MNVVSSESPIPVTGLWSFLGVIITTIIGPAIMAVIAWRSSRSAPTPVTPERVTVEQGLGVSTRGVSDETVSLVARLYGDLASLRVEFGMEVNYSDELEEHIEIMKKGHAEGRFPPWPEMPTRKGSTRHVDLHKDEA